MFGNPQKFLAILDGEYPNFQGELTFRASHPHWVGMINFNVGLKRAELSINNTTASYEIAEGFLLLRWDNYPTELFKVLDDGLVYVCKSQRAHPQKVVVVTAYYKEKPDIIRRCIDSVQGQTHSTEHILIADGYAQDWIDKMPVRHIRLDRSHGDYGNTPRGVGALLAISHGSDAIGFLDADNWLEPNHVSTCLSVSDTQPEADFVIAKWNLRRPDKTIIPFPSEPGHVDTNCFFFLRGSFHIIPHFSLMNKELSSIGDRIFFSALRSAGLKSAVVGHPTVNYHCIWANVYRAMGEAVPIEAKEGIDSAEVEKWLRSLDPRDLEYVSRRAGVRFA